MIYLRILNEFDSKTLITFDDIPNSLVAETYFYKVSDNAEVILNNIIKKSNEISKKFGMREISKFPSMMLMSYLYLLLS